MPRRAGKMELFDDVGASLLGSFPVTTIRNQQVPTIWSHLTNGNHGYHPGVDTPESPWELCRLDYFPKQCHVNEQCIQVDVIGACNWELL
jgi:hypothetical protein